MTSTRIRSVDEIVASLRASRLLTSPSLRTIQPYSDRDIRNPWLRGVVNLACDAEAILSGFVHFEPSRIIELRDRLGQYSSSSLAQLYAARLDDLGYVVDLSAGTLDGQVQFDLGRVGGLIRELEPFTGRSGEIRRLHAGLTTEYRRHGPGSDENHSYT